METKIPLEHYLISATTIGGHVHFYVMARDAKTAFGAVVTVTDKMERDDGLPITPCFLQTRLDGDPREDAVTKVRKIINHALDGQAGRLWNKAKEFHITGFYMPSAHADDARLMRMH